MPLSNVTFYALSGSMIGNFLKSGGYGTSAQGHCTLDSPPIINNEWSAKINGTLGPLTECGGENGETMCIPQMCTVRLIPPKPHSRQITAGLFPFQMPSRCGWGCGRVVSSRQICALLLPG